MIIGNDTSIRDQVIRVLAMFRHAEFRRPMDPVRDFRNYLEAYIRDEFLDGLKPNFQGSINSIFRPLVKKFRVADDEIFLSSIVDHFMDDNLGEDIRSLLKSEIKAKYNLSPEKAGKVIAPVKIEKEEKEELEKVINEASKSGDIRGLFFKFLQRSFLNRAQEWAKKRDVESPMMEETPEQISEMEDETEKKYDWMEGLIKDCHDLINRKVKDEEKRGIFKKILWHRFLKKPEKTQAALTEELNIPRQTLSDYELKLAGWLKEFLKNQGLGGSFLEEGGMERKEVIVPDYREVLKDSDNVEDLKKFIEPTLKDPRMTDQTRYAIKLYVEGKTIDDVASKIGLSRTRAKNIKTDYFNPRYKAWYTEKVEEIRKACDRIRVATRVLLGAIPKFSPQELKEIQELSKKFVKKEPMFKGRPGEKPAEPVKPGEPKKEPEKKPEEGPADAAEAMAAHWLMVKNAIKKEGLRVTVYFSSKSKASDIGKEGFDPSKFKYLKYEVDIPAPFNERAFGKKVLSIDYLYERNLKEDGTFSGEGSSYLKIDEKKVDDDLKKHLDNFVKSDIEPEGVLPHKFRSRYINEEIGESYPGLHKFRRNYPQQYFPSDPVHKERVEKYEELQERKRLGPRKWVSESEESKTKDLLYDLRRQLRMEETKKLEKDEKKTEDLKNQISELEKILKGKSKKDLEEVEDIVKEMNLLRTAYQKTIFPEPRGKEIKELLNILERNRVSDKPNPMGWLGSDEIRILAKNLRGFASNLMQKELKDLKKQKGLKKDERDTRQKEIIERFESDIEQAKKFIKHFPDDLKSRRDEFKKEKPAEYESFARSRDMGWVDNEAKVQDTISKAVEDLSKKIEEEVEKQRVVRLVQRVEYKVLQNFLEEEKEGLDTLANRFEKTGVLPVAGVEIRSQILDNINKSRKGLEVLSKKIVEMEKKELSPDEEKELKRLKDQIPSFLKELDKNAELMDKLSGIPARDMAQTILNDLDYFSSLYSFFVSLLWFRERSIIQAAEDTKEDEKPSKKITEEFMKNFKNKIIGVLKGISETLIWKENAIKSGVAKAKAMLKQFISYIPQMEESRTAMGMSLPYSLVISKEEEIREEGIIKFLFPEEYLDKAQSLISSLKKSVSDIAESELRTMKNNLVSAFKEGLPIPKIQALAKKEGISENQVRVRLKRHEDALAKAAINQFIENWTQVKKREKVRERSPLGNRPSGEYDKMGDFVEKFLPSLFDLVPPSEEPKVPSPGIPTPREIRERIENAFGRVKPDEMKEFYERAQWGFGGGGKGPKTKGRKKVMKTDLIVEGTWEDLKDQTIRLIQIKNPRDIIYTILATQVKHLRDKIKNLGENEFIDPDDVIDSFVALLKQLYNTILRLRIGPSGKSAAEGLVVSIQDYSRPPGTHERGKGAPLPPAKPMFTGRPEIPVDSYKEGISLFHKIKGIYDVINELISPDKVGVPPENLSEIRSKSGLMKKYLPSGLVDWINYFEDSPKLEKKSLLNFPTRMSFNIAQRFVGIENFHEDQMIFS